MHNWLHISKLVHVKSANKCSEKPQQEQESSHREGEKVYRSRLLIAHLRAIVSRGRCFTQHSDVTFSAAKRDNQSVHYVQLLCRGQARKYISHTDFSIGIANTSAWRANYYLQQTIYFSLDISGFYVFLSKVIFRLSELICMCVFVHMCM